MLDMPMPDKQAAFLQKLEPGDILVMTSLWRFEIIGRAIRWWTNGDDSHTVLYSGNGNLVEAIWSGVREIHWSQTPYPQYYRVTILRPTTIPVEQRHKAIEFARQQVGKRYDYLMLIFNAISIMLSWFHINTRGVKNWLDVKNWYYCVELILDSYFEGTGHYVIDSRINRGQGVPSDFIVHGNQLTCIGSYHPNE